ncbi:MAG: hypothetical protein MI919_42790 [Holophagales bacterium]|nr:hypothetical protein [Holophagales bacterium]
MDNPAPNLEKREATLRPGRFFRTTAELDAAYKVATDKKTRRLIDSGSDPLRKVDEAEKLAELASANSKGYIRRFFSAFEMTFGHSERDPTELKQDPASPEFRSDDGEFVYRVTLDLDQLVVFPAEVREAYDTLERHLKLDPLERVELEPFDSGQCAGDDPVRCLRKTSGLPVRGRWLAGVLPTIKFETKDQFDFILAGGEAFPLQEDTLETITVTWDLTSALDIAKQRRDAIKALAAHRRIQEREARRGREPLLGKSSIDLPKGFPLPVQLRSCYRGYSTDKGECEGRPPELTWKVHEVAQSRDGAEFEPLGDDHPIEINPKGQLKAEDAEPGRYRIRLCLVDDVGNASRLQQELTLDVHDYSRPDAKPASSGAATPK